jgi:Lon protease-like protein
VSLRRIALFPLPLVLLPRAPQPLHIFEPRYRRLLADVLAGDREFGIIFRTPDIAEHAIPPGTAGCVAHIESAQELPDGRSNILVTGGDRFELRSFVDHDAPYLLGEVEPFEDDAESPSASGEAARRIREVFERVGRAARAMQDDATPLPDLPDDPALLSFAIAQHVDLDLRDKQLLLASRSPLGRLRHLDQILSPFVESVEMRALVHQRARSNGHGAH